jgi:hypothetical protein
MTRLSVYGMNIAISESDSEEEESDLEKEESDLEKKGSDNVGSSSHECRKSPILSSTLYLAS